MPSQPERLLTPWEQKTRFRCGCKKTTNSCLIYVTFGAQWSGALAGCVRKPSVPSDAMVWGHCLNKSWSINQLARKLISNYFDNRNQKKSQKCIGSLLLNCEILRNYDCHFLTILFPLDLMIKKAHKIRHLKASPWALQEDVLFSWQSIDQTTNWSINNEYIGFSSSLNCILWGHEGTQYSVIPLIKHSSKSSPFNPF